MKCPLSRCSFFCSALSYHCEVQALASWRNLLHQVVRCKISRSRCQNPCVVVKSHCPAAAVFLTKFLGRRQKSKLTLLPLLFSIQPPNTCPRGRRASTCSAPYLCHLAFKERGCDRIGGCATLLRLSKDCLGFVKTSCPGQGAWAVGEAASPSSCSHLLRELTPREENTRPPAGRGRYYNAGVMSCENNSAS